MTATVATSDQEWVQRALGQGLPIVVQALNVLALDLYLSGRCDNAHDMGDRDARAIYGLDEAGCSEQWSAFIDDERIAPRRLGPLVGLVLILQLGLKPTVCWCCGHPLEPRHLAHGCECGGQTLHERLIALYGAELNAAVEQAARFYSAGYTASAVAVRPTKGSRAARAERALQEQEALDQEVVAAALRGDLGPVVQAEYEATYPALAD